MKRTLLLVILLSAPVPARAASFDCKKAASAVEKMICADGELSAFDRKLARAYERAQSLTPEPFHLQDDQRDWLRKTREACADVACLRNAYAQRIAELEAQKEVTAFFDKAPFVNPRIVEELGSEIQDTGDQVLSVCVTDSQTANKYFVDPPATASKRKDGQRPGAGYQDKDAEHGDRPTSSFSYTYIGRTTSGVDVLLTNSWTGGDGIFMNLLLVTLQYENTGMSPRLSAAGDQTVTFKRRRLVIRKLGEIGLSDRWIGDLAVSGNQIHIGKDEGFFSDRYPMKARVVTVDYRP
jgi:uncharacterized protein